MSDNPFSTDTIKKSLDELEDEPKNEVNVGLVAENSDVGVVGSASKDLGKPGGWFVIAEGSWMRKAGAKVAALLSWKGK